MMASMDFSCLSSTCASLGIFANGPTLGSMPINCSIEPILRIWLQLVAEVLERELVLAQLAFHLARLLLVDGFLAPFRSGRARRPCPGCARRCGPA